MNEPLACVVLAAGKGTRMKSALPKVEHAILGKPMGHWPVGMAVDLDAAAVIVVVGHQAERVEASLNARFSDRVRCALQAEQNGTGHAVQMAMPALDEDFDRGTVLILYGDTPLLRVQTLRDLISLRESSGAPLCMLTAVVDDPTGYGRIVRDAQGRVLRIVEHKDASDVERQICEMNPGIYAVEVGFLRSALDRLSNDNAQGEYYLTDIVAMAVDEGHSAGVPTVDCPQEDILGVNDRAQLADAEQILAARIRDRHLHAGVSLEMPNTILIEPDVCIGRDTRIERGAILRGRTRVGEGATIGAGAIVRDSVIADGAVVHPYSVFDDATVGENAQAGPFCRLRPKAELGRGAKAGNFVELKNAVLDAGAKASHLTYLGDVRVGADSNLGAGTVVCNYDGVNKHLSQIGERVFVGSNSTLVSPLTIEDGAYVVAASRISRNVPADAVAESRVRQENKPDLAPRLRRRAENRKKTS